MSSVTADMRYQLPIERMFYYGHKYIKLIWSLYYGRSLKFQELIQQAPSYPQL